MSAVLPAESENGEAETVIASTNTKAWLFGCEHLAKDKHIEMFSVGECALEPKITFSLVSGNLTQTCFRIKHVNISYAK